MKKGIALFCVFLLVLPITASANHATMDNILAYKKAEYGTTAYLLDTEFANLAGTSSGDWFVLAMKNAGYADNYDAYLTSLTHYVEEKYKTKDKLHRIKATEWHRIILVMHALGGNPADVSNTMEINLLQDGIYNRSDTAPLGAQGLNGYIWALLALDAAKSAPPENAADTRESIINAILAAQNTDGGFSLAGGASDADITAMAVQALAPYASAASAIERALTFLSGMQGDTGSMYTQGTETAETTAQTVLALCALGIAPEKDARFIKNGNTLLDGLYRYCSSDGSVRHTADSGANDMAAEQVFLALAAYMRLPKVEAPPEKTPPPAASPAPTPLPTELPLNPPSADEVQESKPHEEKQPFYLWLGLPMVAGILLLILKRKK